jgi:hypothetical protein
MSVSAYLALSSGTIYECSQGDHKLSDRFSERNQVEASFEVHDVQLVLNYTFA